MATNKLTEVAGLVAQAVMGAKFKDKDGNAKTLKPTGDDNLLDLTDIVAGGSTGGNAGGTTGGNPTGTDTSGGINVIPASLSDGSLTERNLEWKGTTATDKETNITFLNDVGLNLNQVGDGLQFWGHMQRVKVTDGVKADADTVPLNFDPENTKKDSYYTTTSPIPFSISRDKLPTGKKVTITLNGLGEGLDNIVDHVSPTISFTFNQDKTLTVLPTEGHDLDSGTKDYTGTVKTNGAFYTFVLDKVNNYSVQSPVTQLPNGTILANGAFIDNVTLNTAGFMDNIGGGLEFDVDTYIYGRPNQYTRFSLSEIGLPTKFFIKKECLINNDSSSFIDSDFIPDYTKLITYQDNTHSGGWSNSSNLHYSLKNINVNFVNVSNNTLNFDYCISLTLKGSPIIEAQFKILSIKSWDGVTK